jgi:carbon monoxide dehydrogenase subunit G
VEIANSFHVAVPPDQAFDVFSDGELLAPCMPGAQLQEIEGDVYRGTVKVKLGPVSMQYQGTAVYTERDRGQRRLVLRATGRETRGQGNASADITVRLLPESDGTRVEVNTDLSITGKAAQFGRGMIVEVSEKLLAQFVDRLEQLLADPPATRTSEAVGAGRRSVASGEVEALDLGASALGPLAKRALPVAAALVVLVLVAARARRRS